MTVKNLYGQSIDIRDSLLPSEESHVASQRSLEVARSASTDSNRIREASSPLTLGELLQNPDLGLKLIAGGRESYARPVAQVVVFDVCNDEDLEHLEGSIVLAGEAINSWEARQVETLLSDLKERGASAIGIASREPGGRVRPTVRQPALSAGLPLFILPPQTSCNQLLRFINAAREKQIEELRLLSAHDYLMDAVRESSPADAIIRRLGHLIGGAALLFNDGGHVVTATGTTGDSPADEIWSEISRRTATLQQFDVRLFHVTSVPIRTDDRIRYWLAAVTRRAVVSAEPWRSMFRAAERLLELLALSQTDAEADEQALRAGLLAVALEERDPGRLLEISHRIARFGITFNEPCRVMLATFAAAPRSRRRPSSPPLAVAADRLRATLADHHVPCLLDVQTDKVAALLQGENHAVDRWVAALAREDIHVVAGLGREHTSIGDARESLQDAQLALMQIEQRQGGAVQRIEQSDLSRWLISGIPRDQLAPKVTALLASVKAQPRLYTTLVAYLDSDMDLSKTASALHLHVNSVRYRLARIEEILDRSIHRVAAIADLYLAVTADRSTLIPGY
jgi:PucR-like helix-turn-helix protein/diguanylate cyclase with GGDEF domain